MGTKKFTGFTVAKHKDVGDKLKEIWAEEIRWQMKKES